MEYQDNLIIIEKSLSWEALLRQLAEEAIELSGAILEYREKTMADCLVQKPSLFSMGGYDEWKAVVEEAADIDLVMQIVLEKIYDENSRKIRESIMVTVKVVTDTLTSDNVLRSMQKGCHDIGKAALKLIRSMGEENPTPITEAEAKNNLLSYMAAMWVLLEKRFGTTMFATEIEKIKTRKAERWVHRLMGGIEDEGVYEDRQGILGK